jgi:hypothetical protein
MLFPQVITILPLPILPLRLLPILLPQISSRFTSIHSLVNSVPYSRVS